MIETMPNTMLANLIPRKTIASLFRTERKDLIEEMTILQC